MLLCFGQTNKSLPEHFDARVVKVFDSDTFEALYNDSLYRVRLSDIDAPEAGQEFYEEAKQLLMGLSFDKFVVIENKGLDKYSRTLSIVHRKNRLVKY